MAYKQVIIARRDLKLSPGKLSAQVAHASVQASDKADPEIKELWQSEGAKKIILIVKTKTELIELFQTAKEMGFPTALIKDAGHTEIAPGTITVLGIGPDTETNIDKLTGSLSLLD